MRCLCALAIGLTVLAGLAAQPAGKGKGKTTTRYGVELDLEGYPQNTPKDALGSVLKVLAEKRYDYLLAQLADPAFVKARLKVYKGDLPKSLTDASKDVLAFQRLVKATTEHFHDNPTELRELARFFKEGQWEVGEATASATYKLVPARKVFLKKIDARWYLQNRDK